MLYFFKLHELILASHNLPAKNLRKIAINHSTKIIGTENVPKKRTQILLIFTTMISVLPFLLTLLWQAQSTGTIQQVAVDILGYHYTCSEHEITQYNTTGDSLHTYTATHKSISSIDVSNPLSILVFYNDYDIIEILDKSMHVSQKISLLQLQIKNASAIARSKDNNIWVYDDMENTLIKINDNGEKSQDHIDMTLFTQQDWNIHKIQEHADNIYLLDSLQGILKLDYWGQYKGVLHKAHIQDMQIVDGKVLYLSQHKIYLQKDFISDAQLLYTPHDVDCFYLHQDQISIAKDSLYQVSTLHSR